MQVLIVKFLGTFHILLGFLYLLIPIILIELGRPKDLIKGGIFLLIGFYLLLQQSIFNVIYSILLILHTILIVALVFEVISNRWNQLSENEKLELKKFSPLKKKFNLFINSFNINLQKISIGKTINKSTLKNSNKKKWVRSDDGNTLQNDKEKNIKNS